MLTKALANYPTKLKLTPLCCCGAKCSNKWILDTLGQIQCCCRVRSRMLIASIVLSVCVVDRAQTRLCHNCCEGQMENCSFPRDSACPKASAYLDDQDWKMLENDLEKLSEELYKSKADLWIIPGDNSTMPANGERFLPDETKKRINEGLHELKTEIERLKCQPLLQDSLRTKLREWNRLALSPPPTSIALIAGVHNESFGTPVKGPQNNTDLTPPRSPSGSERDVSPVDFKSQENTPCATAEDKSNSVNPVIEIHRNHNSGKYITDLIHAVCDLETSLGKDTDALQQAQAIADNALQSHTETSFLESELNSMTRRLRTRPRSAQKREQFSFEDSDTDNDEINAPISLSGLPSSITRKRKVVHGRRRLFTDEEKQAIRDGINIYGVGKWADIKAHFAIVLRHRTSVQIKDCFRTMVKKGEI